MYPRRRPAAGLSAGAISGLAASWLMLRFIQGPGFKLQESLKTPQDHNKNVRDPQSETVSMRAADTFASHAPGGRHLTRAEKSRAVLSFTTRLAR